MKPHIRREEGQGLVEYALIIVLIAIVVIVALRALGPQISLLYSRIAYQLANPNEDISGPPVRVNSISVNASADCNPITGACSNVRATANVTLVDDAGNSVSAEAHVQFTNGGTSKTATGVGSISATGLGTGSSGDSVQACVVAVTGHSLSGGGCSTDAY